MKMFAAILVLSCLAVCHSVTISEYGLVQKGFKLASEWVYAEADDDHEESQVREVVFSTQNITVPDSEHGPAILKIDGIKHINYSHGDVEVTMPEGELSERPSSVKLLVKSPVGEDIYSLFEFYGVVTYPEK